jgi:hypothetical protein
MTPIVDLDNKWPEAPIDEQDQQKGEPFRT